MLLHFYFSQYLYIPPSLFSTKLCRDYDNKMMVAYLVDFLLAPILRIDHLHAVPKNRGYYRPR